ncbi:ATP-grasp domain-containing protein [Roseomonas gilardii]|uniref:ATP-grasp domain-containing protein n=1 Tax=Roseomonas gilardii TaxID=257708 RepID=UPI0031F5CEE0
MEDGTLLGNEIAPRPHNSGHWTPEACIAGQFEQQARAVAGLPLGSTTRHADAVMRNLIGPEGMARWPSILGAPGVVGQLYGKGAPRPGRKMGHANLLLPLGTLAETDEAGLLRRI